MNGKLLKIWDTPEQDSSYGRDEGGLWGKHVVLVETFLASIREHFRPRTVEIKFSEDWSGLEYVKVNGEDGIFELFTEYTRPTHMDLINTVFNRDGHGTVKDIATLEAFIVTTEDRSKKLREICIRYEFPEYSLPAQWTLMTDDTRRVCSALEEWHGWLHGKCPMFFLH